MPPAARRRVVVGVDGCRGGWVAAVVPAAGPGPTSVVVGPDLGGLLDGLGPVAAVGVDMLLALPAAGRRECDDEARRRLGPRRSSIFPAPLAVTVGSPDHAEAVRRARAAGGPAPSIQAFNLLPKIVEAMAIAARHHLHEVSPELSFAVLAGAPLLAPKRSADGAAARLALVRSVFPDAVAAAAGAARDDVLDAYAVAWTARRIATGTAERLGPPDGPAIWV